VQSIEGEALSELPVTVRRFLSSLIPSLPSEDELEALVGFGREQQMAETKQTDPMYPSNVSVRELLDDQLAEDERERKALFCDEYVVRAAAQASAARGITIAVRRLDPNDARALWENAERLWKARPENLK
jgi:hypothetical protein